jgi:hypothetical protein
MKFIISLFVLVFFGACSSKVALPEDKVASFKIVLGLDDVFKNYSLAEMAEQEILKKGISYPREGEKNAYEIVVDKDLESLYRSYLSGDAKEALKLVSHIQKSSIDPKMLWQASMLKMKTLVMLGRGDDALAEYQSCQKYELSSFNSNLNCLALRGETYVWSGDYSSATKDLTTVLNTIGEWELPTSYMAPPSNMADLVSVATAQLRAYTSVAAMFILQENYAEAYKWAEEADKRYNSVLYVSNHWLYGKFLNIHIDTYYGKASNLTFLAAAKLAQKNEADAQKDFDKAHKFFEMIGYKKGIATILAFKARVYNRTGEHHKCEKAGEVALKYSLQNKFLDFVWRVEALRGETFAQLGDDKRAENSYRQAVATINSLSSAHSSDLSKRRFGFSKDDISLALLNIDKKKQDYQQLFVDLEHSRARAFVDMLSKRTIHIQDERLNELYKIDKELQELKILTSAVIETNSANTKKMDALEIKRVKILAALKDKDPRLSTVASVWSSSLKDIQNSLEDNYILYFLPLGADATIEYLLISKDSIKLSSLDISHDKLNELLKQLSAHLGIDSIHVRALKKLVKSEDVKKDSLTSVLDSLNKVLKIEELASKDVYMIPNETTGFIPWGMLEVGYMPSILPTASWLNLKNINIDSQKVVVLADPNFGGDAVQLDGAKSEALSVSKEFGIQPITGSEATKEQLYKSVSSGVDILHFATHGIFYKNRPLDSALLLSDGSKSDPLSAKEVFQKPLRSNLVVLSACDSGLGSSASEQDYLGLSRSFFLSGSKAILSSLYSIDDKGTSDFMRALYKHAKGSDYGYAYKKSIEELKRLGYPPSVYGAFILQGLKRIDR